MMLPVLLTLVAAVPALAVSASLLILNYELLAGIWSSRDRHPVRLRSEVRAVIMIPAHNEEACIGATLAQLLAQLPASIRILVVADNCDDDTAKLARAAGADVIERNDPARRAKGYALEFGRDYLATQGMVPDVVVIFDADCRAVDDAIEKLVAFADISQRPTQAAYLFESAADCPPMIQISNFAILVKNKFRSRGLQRLGGAALLTGTGMAFPWTQFVAADLGSGSLVEDLAMGISLTQAGHPPQLIETAIVLSDPPALSNLLGQRRRWEHGFLDILRRSALPTLASGIARRSTSEVLLGLHLLVPPIALLLYLATGATVLAAGLVFVGAAIWPLQLVAMMTIAALLLLYAAWLAGGYRYLTVSGLARAPLYLIWKLTIYTSFFRGAESKWIRTPRQHP